MNIETLKKDLELKTYGIFERPGSLAIQAFFDAKKACITAGIPDEEINGVVYAATAARKP